METMYIVRGKKIVTVSSLGTIHNGAMLIANGRISDIGTWENIHETYQHVPVADYSNFVITPSLVDCHTHLLEFAPTSLYPVTSETHLLAGKAILLQALSAGITALGEQICGHPLVDFPIQAYRKAVLNMPLDVSFATTSISIGFEKMAHFSAITQSRGLDKQELTDRTVVQLIAQESDYPGENIFINATPANFTQETVPRAGEIIYTLSELQQIVEIYHCLGKKMGAHVAGEQGIQMALTAGVDVLHHAHGITEPLLRTAAKQQVAIVATPMGGTHLRPNSPEEILAMVEKNIAVSISTDAYLPPYPGVSWLPFQDQTVKGPAELMVIAQPAMQLLKKQQYDENEILALLTANPATVLKREHRYGRLIQGLDANFLVAEGIPGLDIVEVKRIRKVFFRGREVINRM